MKRPAPERLSALAALLPPREADALPPVDEIDRIMALPLRPPVNCEQDASGRYAPATQALIEHVTAQLTRGPRLTCGCAPRRATMIAPGMLAIARILPEGELQPPPAIVTMDALAADSRAHRQEWDDAQRMGNLRVGETLELPSVDGSTKQCITVLNAQQAWTLYEAPIIGGTVGFQGVGSGKCLGAGSEVFDVLAGRRRLVEETGVLQVASFDGERLCSREASAFPSGRKKCCLLSLADGSTLTLSLDHKVYTSRGWVEAGQLGTNDFVAVPTRVPEPLRATEATDDEIALVALMLADGGCNNGTPSFTNETPSVIEEFQRLARVVCKGFSEDKSCSRAREFNLLGSNGRHANGTGFREKWDLYGLSKEKRVKAEIWGLSQTQIALFLNRFWACDGHVSKQEIECTLASEKLIDDLRFLLLRIGVRSRKRYKKATCEGKSFDAWRISISGADALTFLNTVGDVLGKETACQKLRQQLQNTKRNTNFDIVPIGRRELQEICDELGIAKRPSKYDGAQPRNTIRRFFQATTGQFVSRKRFVEFCKQQSYRGKYAFLGTEDLGWERVVSVENAGIQPVFDLSVPITHNFIANNMIVHNTITNLLLPLLFPDAALAVICIEPKQRLHYKHHYLRLREHFRVTTVVLDDNTIGFHGTVQGTVPTHLISYSVLSQTKNSDMLDRLDPDVLVLDEAHRACGDSAINKRIKRFIHGKIQRREQAMAAGRPARVRAVNLFPGSGTLENKSVQDTQMLCSYALGTGSPLPLDPDVAVAMSAVMDATRRPDRESAFAKRLQMVFTGRIFAENDIVSSLFGEPEKEVRQGFQRRRSHTFGIITASSSSVNASIYIAERKAPPMPESVRDALRMVRAEAKRPDGEELAEKMHQVECARDVIGGFYRYWAFPKHKCSCGGVEPRCEGCVYIDDWFNKRKAFSKELRAKLAQGELHLDTDKLCREAAKRFWQDPPYQGSLPKWDCQSWPAWAAIENTVEHVEKTKWIGGNDGFYLARDAAEWATSNKGVLWFKSEPFGRKIAELAGIPYFNGGPGGEARLAAEKGDRSIVCSIKAHGAGTDGLQHKFHKQLIVEPPASNGGNEGMEQLLGRLHRPGQRADVVETYCYLHASELVDAWRQVVLQAEFNHDMLKTKQRVLMADMDFEL